MGLDLVALGLLLGSRGRSGRAKGICAFTSWIGVHLDNRKRTSSPTTRTIKLMHRLPKICSQPKNLLDPLLIIVWWGGVEQRPPTRCGGSLHRRGSHPFGGCGGSLHRRGSHTFGGSRLGCTQAAHINQTMFQPLLTRLPHFKRCMCCQLKPSHTPKMDGGKYQSHGFIYCLLVWVCVCETLVRKTWILILLVGSCAG